MHTRSGSRPFNWNRRKTTRMETLKIPKIPVCNLQTRRSRSAVVTWTPWIQFCPSLAAHRLHLPLLLCTRLVVVLHPLPRATPPPRLLNPKMRGASSMGLMLIVSLRRMKTFKLQEMRAIQTKDSEPIPGPAPRPPRARKARLARRRRRRGARKPSLPLPLPTLRWLQCKVINYTKQSTQLVHWLYRYSMLIL